MAALRAGPSAGMANLQLRYDCSTIRRMSLTRRLPAPILRFFWKDRTVAVDSNQSVAALAALSHETRLAVYRLLVQRGPDGLSAGAIAQTLVLPPSSLTFHLQQLMHAGLITQRRMSRQLFYATDFAVMNGLVDYLTENCCGGAVRCAAACDQPAGADSDSSKSTAA